MAVAGLVLGIVSCVSVLFALFLPWWWCFIALAIAIVGLVLSVQARKKVKTGIATAGLVIGIIAVIFTGIMSISCAVCALACKAAEDTIGGLVNVIVAKVL